MRKLTIQRTKSFVACLMKMKIYIEDPVAGEMVINNVPCRKLGELKNGEEKTFAVEEHSARVFVIADTPSKNYCNEFYILPQGSDDIFLSGKNKFNPANGNAFRFDNNENETVLANRKRGTRKGLIVLIAAIIVGAVAGYLISSNLFTNPTPEKKTFSSDGMTITLTDAFEKVDIQGYTVSYGSEKAAVFSLKEEFSLLEGFENYTLEQYGDMVIQNNGLDSCELKTAEGLTYFEYDFTNTDTNETYHYFTYVYKTNDAFWTVSFTLLKQDTDDYAQQITEWAKSVTFTN